MIARPVMMRAIVEGNVKGVRECIADVDGLNWFLLCGDTILAEDERHLSPIQLAVKHGKDEIVCLLLENGANFNFIDTYSLSKPVTLIDALRCLTVDTIKKLIVAGAQVDVVDENSSTLLHVIADKITDELEYTCLVPLLMDAGVNVNAKDMWQRTPLDKFASVFSALQSDSNVPDESSIKDLVNTIDKLISVRANPTPRVRVIVRAAQRPQALLLVNLITNSHLVKRLIATGEDVNAVNKVGDAALVTAMTHPACYLERHQVEVAKSLEALVRAPKLNVKACDGLGSTVKELAAYYADKHGGTNFYSSIVKPTLAAIKREIKLSEAVAMQRLNLFSYFSRLAPDTTRSIRELVIQKPITRDQDHAFTENTDPNTSTRTMIYLGTKITNR